jgi:NAD(P)H-dependent flavin oxidoreductase YrpB (nitropropane dioxygenase family)
MHTPLCEKFGIQYPIFAFTRAKEVVAEVSKAGGMGVLGAIAFSVDELEPELEWLDAHVEGKPYGVDVVMPAGIVDAAPPDLESMIPERHRAFVEDVLKAHNVPQLPETDSEWTGLLAWVHNQARSQVEIALSHPIKLLANALGPPPTDVVKAAHDKGVPVAALIGKAEHARSQVAAGVDIIIAQGTEAGGHTGDVSTMILVPEIVDAVAPTPVLAAGGIGTGRQAAAALALGAQGIWTGSIWLSVAEADTHPVVVDKLLHATSRDTVRSRSWTGKPARMLRTAWTDAWEQPDSPGTLPMPLQFMLTGNAQSRMHLFAEKEAHELVGTPVGQIVGTMNEVKPAREVVMDIVRGFEEATEQLAKLSSKTGSRP